MKTRQQDFRSKGIRELNKKHFLEPRTVPSVYHDRGVQAREADPKARQTRPHPRWVAPYEPGQPQPFPLSRSKLGNYLTCPYCFYLDARFKLHPPSGPAFTLNAAVDKLLKAEFDHLRQQGKPHPELVRAGVSAVPFQHPDLETYRDARKGIRYLHQPTGLELYGGIDDLLIDKATGKIHVIDFKATAKKDDITCLEGGFSDMLRRQVEVYQYILRKLGHDVSDVAFFYYVNGCADRPAFNGRLDFRVSVIPHQGDTNWIEPTLRQIKDVLEAPQAPKPSAICKHCKFLTNFRAIAQNLANQ